MATRREIDRKLKKIEKVASDRDFALKHGYDAAFERLDKEHKNLRDEHRKMLG